jgi:hypothetical protein
LYHPSVESLSDILVPAAGDILLIHPS